MMSAWVLTVLYADAAFGQTASTTQAAYPSKPIRFITTPVGGGVDFATRIIAQGITGPLGQQVVVDNQSTQVYMELASRAAPDGHTLLMAGGGAIIRPLVSKTSYDTVRDFSPITLAVISPIYLVVHPSVPAHTVQGLIALAKARPGELNFSSPGTGSTNHLAAELFKAMAGVSMVHIPYKGGGPAFNDLIAGQVQLMFATASEATAHLKSGRLRALAVASAQPSPLAPDLPTVAASGLPGFVSLSIVGAYAPVKTPASVITLLNQEIVRYLRTAEAKEKFAKAGIETVASSPDELGATVKAEIARMGKVIRDIGLRAD
jgi:tripartite-type tricarboxylate transporter receptor subunit TctC